MRMYDKQPDNTFEAPNDYRNYLAHHGVKGMHWGVRKQYPRTLLGQAILARKLKKKKISELYGGDKAAYKADQLKKRQAGNKQRKINANPKLAAKQRELSSRKWKIIEDCGRKYFKDKKYQAKVDRIHKERFGSSIDKKLLKEEPDYMNDVFNEILPEVGGSEFQQLAREIDEFHRLSR